MIVTIPGHLLDFFRVKLPLRGIGTLSDKETLSKLFCLLSEKGSSLKGKNLLPLRANSFLLEKTSFSERVC